MEKVHAEIQAVFHGIATHAVDDKFASCNFGVVEYEQGEIVYGPGHRQPPDAAFLDNGGV